MQQSAGGIYLPTSFQSASLITSDPKITIHKTNAILTFSFSSTKLHSTHKLQAQSMSSRSHSTSEEYGASGKVSPLPFQHLHHFLADHGIQIETPSSRKPNPIRVTFQGSSYITASTPVNKK